MNVQVVDGSGTTDGAVNGLGNVLIGYDENPYSHEQSGSHNLIFGTDQTFTSYGGLIAGQYNSITAPYASVSGGVGNTASAIGASVSGGEANVAGTKFSSVSGGQFNRADGAYSSILGGEGHHLTLTTRRGRSAQGIRVRRPHGPGLASTGSGPGQWLTSRRSGVSASPSHTMGV